jgi:rhamnogalacturonan endolyase
MYSNVARGYGIFDSVPANLDFTMGKDEPAKHWFYAQTKKGNWNIHFDLDEVPSGKTLLTLALAGAAKNPTVEVKVNGEKVGEHKPGNDTGIYRSAVRGAYYQLLEWEVASVLLKKGKNTITISLPDVKPGGGIMYDAVKLNVQ